MAEIMKFPSVDLSRFSSRSFDRGRPKPIEILWRVVSALIFQGSWMPSYAFKRVILRCFGASIGRRVFIKPRVFITFPWKLSVGDFAWIGEDAWLDSLDRIEIGPHACISQRAYLCTGSHDYTSPTFNLRTFPIRVERGAWVGAGSIVGPGVRIGEHACVSLGSVVTKDVPARAVVRGNPAEVVRERKIAAA